MKNILELKNLSRHYRILKNREGLWGTIKDLVSQNYKIIKAVDNISMSIRAGEVVGFIGPNGAGKSTTIKMLTGVLAPTSGEIKVNGFIPFKEREKYVKRIGVVLGQRTQLWWDLPVIESFKLLKEIYDIPKQTYEDNMNLFNKMVNINELLHMPARRLSLGQRMLCDIVSSFLHDPEIIFLDEPSIGLDISVKSKIRTIIKDINRLKKVTILITSHDVGDIEALCDRIILIDKGVIIYDGALSKFNEMFGTYRTLKIELPDNETIDEVIKLLKASLGETDALRYNSTDSNWLEITIDKSRITLLDVLNLILKKFSAKDIKVEETELEQLVKNVYEEVLK